MVSETVPIVYEVKEGGGEKVLIPVALFECETSISFNLLCGLMKGTVIMDLEKDKYVEMPDLDTFTMSEWIILDTILDLEKFMLNELCQKANISDFNAENILRNLLRKGIIITEGNGYIVTDVARFFKYPDEFATLTNVVLKMVEYDKKLEPKIMTDSLQKLFEHFMHVKNITMAYILVRVG